MSPVCESATQEVGNGVAAALQAVDCVAGETTAAAFGRLFAPGGALLTVLTILLTLYVAFFAINLLIGRASLGVRSLTPRMMTLGLVLTFVTSWVAYSTVVWNVAVGGPDQIATIITGSEGSATQVFGQKIDVMFEALQQASPDQADGGEAGQQQPGQQDTGITPAPRDISAFSPDGMMWLGAMLFLLGTVGVLVTARIALAVVIATGPIFVVMVLFQGTRGVFTGWLKALVMLALVPLFAVLGGSVMLELAVPVLAELVRMPGQVDPQAAVAFFMIGAVHMALMIMVLKVTGTMVSGWRVFGLVPDKEDRGERASSGGSAIVMPPAQVAPVQPAASAPDRRIPVSSFAVAPPANDGGLPGEGGRRDTRVVTREVASAGAQVAPLNPAGQSRARGIGSRFKAPAPRLSEKLK